MSSLEEAKENADKLLEGELVTISVCCDEKAKQNALFNLKKIGIEVKDSCMILKSHVQDCLRYCIDHDEAELLEVFFVAFKMICEK